MRGESRRFYWFQLTFSVLVFLIAALYQVAPLGVAAALVLGGALQELLFHPADSQADSRSPHQGKAFAAHGGYRAHAHDGSGTPRGLVIRPGERVSIPVHRHRDSQGEGESE